MSYCIEYSPHKNKLYPKAKGKKKMFPILLCIIFTLTLIYIFAAYNITSISNRYFSELDKLAAYIREGTGVGQAISVYCEQLFVNVKAD